MASASDHSHGRRAGKELRRGFSTGTAVTAAAVAALRLCLTGRAVEIVAVRLPNDVFLPVAVKSCLMDGRFAVATVVKDGGDDPDVTHNAELSVRLKCDRRAAEAFHPEDPRRPEGHRDERRSEATDGSVPGIRLIAGEGVGVVTKAGLPVQPGEPAVNPVPREMIVRNLADELRRTGGCGPLPFDVAPIRSGAGKPNVLLPWSLAGARVAGGPILEIEIEVPKGSEIARHTLNPRLGVVGGISILGTTGLVKPFSHEAYEETIHASLSVAAACGCRGVVLSTGGKSERLARSLLPELEPEAFVQVADFFGYSVREVARMGFRSIIHSAFFGKVVKMAQGHAYTHAHKVALDLSPVAECAEQLGHDTEFCSELAGANTARQALDLLLGRDGVDVLRAVSCRAAEQSRRLSGDRLDVRVLLFAHDGTLLADVTEPCRPV